MERTASLLLAVRRWSRQTAAAEDQGPRMGLRRLRPSSGRRSPKVAVAESFAVPENQRASAVADFEETARQDESHWRRP